MDLVVEELRAAGIEPLVVVLGSPPWANKAPPGTEQPHLYVPPSGDPFERWLAHYADFIMEAAERYSDVVQKWEIWNEPNLMAFWNPSPSVEAYRLLYERVRGLILRQNSRAQIAVGGLAGLVETDPSNIPGIDFLRHLLAAGVKVDHVAIHIYPSGGHAPNRHITGANNFDDIELVRDQLEGLGDPVPIWLTEWGWSSAEVGLTTQARYVDTALDMLESQYPYVTVATYFLDHDRLPRLAHGLLDARLNPKPAAAVFREHALAALRRCPMRRPHGTRQRRDELMTYVRGLRTLTGLSCPQRQWRRFGTSVEMVVQKQQCEVAPS